ncbi:MAG TPA: NmrA family transcriptional regulator [Flavobacteriia bacterium]|nr:NmrA family transcriptional regulator [Flavobacteriia bacterium]
MNNNKILVLGGKGKTGRKVNDRLIKLGHITRIGSRNEAVPFDWEDENTWPDILDGINKLYITFQPDLAVPSAFKTIKRFTSLAVKTGIQKIVLLSGRGEKEAQRCEQIIMNTDVNWTVVRCDWFSQNFSENFLLEPIVAGHVALPRANILIPFVDTDDIADVVVTALLDDIHTHKIYELTGPRLLTFEQAVNEIAKVTGRNITFEEISLKAYKKMLRAHQIPEDYIWLVNYLFSNVLDGKNSSTTNDIEIVLKRKAKDFSEYVKETAATKIWNPAK